MSRPRTTPTDSLFAGEGWEATCKEVFSHLVAITPHKQGCGPEIGGAMSDATDALDGLPPDLIDALRKYGHLIPQSRNANLVMGAYEAPATTASTLTNEQWMHAWVAEWQRANRAETEAESLRDLCLPVVERYGAHWRKDSDYYAAAEALGIAETVE